MDGGQPRAARPEVPAVDDAGPCAPGGVFDPEWVEGLRRRFAGRPESDRPDLYFTAVAPERAGVRAWIETQVEGLTESTRADMIARLRNDKEFVGAFHELAAAAVFRDAGSTVKVQPRLDGKTPDLLVTPLGGPRIVVEVWTRSTPDDVRGARRSWQALMERVRGIPCPVGLVVEGPRQDRHLQPPDSNQAKQMAAALREWLLRSPRNVGDAFRFDGYTFRVAVELPGMTARLAHPGPGGTVDSDLVIEAILTKTRRYADVAERLEAPLVVVVAADSSMPLSLGFLQAALQGRQTFEVTIPAAGSGLISDHTAQMRREHVPFWDPRLSAVGWLDPSLGDPYLTLVPLGGARRPLPSLASARISVEHL